LPLKDLFQKQSADLAEIKKNFIIHGQVKEAELLRLVHLSSKGEKEIRPLATDLLLAPPSSNEIRYYEKLIECLTRKTSSPRKLPMPVLEFLLDTLVMTEKLPPEPEKARFFERLLRKPPEGLLQNMFSKPYPLQPFLRFLSPRAFIRESRHVFRPKSLSRWRILKNRLLSSSPGPPSWARNTLRDLAPLRSTKVMGKDGPQGGGSWLLRGRVLLAPPGRIHTPGHLPPLKQSRWSGLGSKKLQTFDEILHFQGLELEAMRNLCVQVSRQTGRVVLSLHNATLGAAGGWAHDPLSHHFSHRALFRDFIREAKSRRACLLQQHQASMDAAETLEDIWDQRILHPKIRQALWESRVRAELDHRFEEEWQKHLKRAFALIPSDKSSFSENSSPCVWPGPLAFHQRPAIEHLLTQAHERGKNWKRNLLSLGGFIHSGQKLLDGGRLHELVIPWIDKFFISSKRREDQTYLTLLIKWLHHWGGQPLILFWEDTGRAREPSFFLALEEMKKGGHSMRGIGVFDSHGSSRREEASGIIAAEHKNHSFFALRPFTDTHHPSGLQQLLEKGASPSANTYDSSWKDDLCFLYAGTQVADLLSIQTTPENWTPWVRVHHGKVPFGQYLRSRLRQQIGIHPVKRRCVDAAYARWANLE